MTEPSSSRESLRPRTSDGSDNEEEAALLQHEDYRSSPEPSNVLASAERGRANVMPSGYTLRRRSGIIPTYELGVRSDGEPGITSRPYWSMCINCSFFTFAVVYG